MPSIKPRLSVVIPTYNASDLLYDCLESLNNQTVEKNYYEVIVVNDGGARGIGHKLRCSNNNLTIRYFYQENKGAAAARNLGITKAAGEIILFLDDDSLPTTDWLSATIDAWEKFPHFDGIGGYILSETTDSIFCRVNSDFFNWYLAKYSQDKNHPFLATCNAGYKKAILKKVGKFDESFTKAAGEERDLNIRITKIGGRLRVDENVLVYHDRDLTLGSFLKKHYNYGKAAYRIYAMYPELRRLLPYDYVNLYSSVLAKYRTCREKIITFLLLTFSQTCTWLGYHTALLAKKQKMKMN